MPSQPFKTPQQAKADAAGNATFTFAPPPPGSTFEGTVSIPLAGVGVIFTAYLAGTEIQTWAGNAVGGPFFAMPNEALTIKASGMLVGSTLVATWTGTQLPQGESSMPYPSPTPPSPGPSSVQIAQTEQTITFPTDFCQDVLAPPTATALQLYAGFVSGTGTLLAQVKGVESGTNYSDGFVAVPNPGLTVPINPGVDQNYQICWEETTGGSGTWVLTVAASLSSTSGPATVNVVCSCSGGGGGMMAYGIYTGSDPGATGTVTWGAVTEVGATMLQADTQTFDFPAGSVVMAAFTAGVEVPANGSWAFADTATGNMQAVAAAPTTEAAGFPIATFYDFDQTVVPNTKFDATISGAPAYNAPMLLILSAFARP